MLETINIQPLDSAYSTPKYLATCGERHFVVSEPLAKFIETVKKAGSFEEAAVNWSGLSGKAYTADEVRTICERYLSDIMKPEPQEKKTFLWEKELVSESRVDILQRHFRILFRPAVVIAILAIAIVFEIIFFTSDLTVSLGEVDMLTIAVLLVMMLLSSFFHEIGHATACACFGEKAKGIGLGIYLNFPVFYTDVSGIWKLPRKQRMAVNFAGIYFQLIFLLPCLAVYFITGSQIVKYFIYTINFNFIFTLNPFFKFDGYWIMSDMIGIPNLRSKSNWILKNIKDRLLGRGGRKDFWTQIRMREKILLAVYTVGVNIFFLYYAVFVIPKFLKSCWQELPSQIRILVTDLAVGNSISFGQVSSVMAQLIILLLIFFLFYKLIRKLFVHA